MIEKVLVANRGEIATRAFRAANELRIRSVALYAPEDRDSVHRVKADEAYEIGEPGHPVSTYLDPEIAVALAQRVGADAIYPGYGFMSENPELARACAAAGLIFVGPPPEVLGLAGDKTRARTAAREAGVPVLDASEPVETAGAAMAAAEKIGFPVFVKASHGGGGRGMRLVTDPARLAASLEEARNEAAAAFGDGTVYLEQALVRPRHIEVQLLADANGDVVHLYERDCSLQRRHQKVIEITPAPNLAPELRDRICADAVKFARHVGYVNAGTVEFLLDEANGRYAFIEMNPRIQVEHTVTEETTDIDLVRAQLQIAGGETLASLGVRQAGHPPARLRPAVPRHDRGPGQRLPPRLRAHHCVPLAGRCGRAARRGLGLRRRRGLPVLRPAAGEDLRPRTRPAERGVTRAARRRRAARARRQNQPELPARAAQRPRRPRRTHPHDVRRRAPRPLGRGPGRRPRQPAAQAPRRGHRQPRARRPPRSPATRARSSPRAEGRAARRVAPAAARRRPVCVRRGAARAAGDRDHRHHAA